MLGLLRRLKTQKNGVVVDAMRERGIEYPLSYGVSIPTIRKIAGECETDHSLAKYLYKQEIRELKLAALSIAEPKEVGREELEFWAEGVVNIEVAEQLAALLLYDTDVVEELLREWLNSDDELLQYCALLSASRRLMIDEESPDLDIEKIYEKLSEIIETNNREVWMGVARLISMLSRHYPDIQSRSETLLREAVERQLAAADYLRAEFETIWFDE